MPSDRQVTMPVMRLFSGVHRRLFSDQRRKFVSHTGVPLNPCGSGSPTPLGLSDFASSGKYGMVKHISERSSGSVFVS